MARSIFNATLAVGPQEIPVKLYSAVEPRGLSFRLLHEEDHTPVQQRFVHPKTGEPVEYAELRRGLELPEGVVAFEPEELAELEPEPSRAIELVAFYDAGALQPASAWFDRPYYLGPAKPEARGRYVALARALAAEGAFALVRWTMRKRSYRGALRARGDHLVLISLRAAGELIASSELPRPEWDAASERERQMAEQLVDMLAGTPDYESFRERHRERVLAYIEAKREGQVHELPRPRPRPLGAGSLSEDLAASLERAAKERDVA